MMSTQPRGKRFAAQPGPKLPHPRHPSDKFRSSAAIEGPRAERSHTMLRSPEVDDWVAGLAPSNARQAEAKIARLAVEGPLLGAPHTRQLDGKLRELRFELDRCSMRVTYWM